MKKLDDFLKEIGGQIRYDKYPGGTYASIDRATVSMSLMDSSVTGGGNTPEEAIYNLCQRYSGRSIELNGKRYTFPTISFEDFIKVPKFNLGDYK